MERTDTFVDKAKYFSHLIAHPRVKKRVLSSPISLQNVEDNTDSPEIFPNSKRFSVPYFIILISITELLVFMYHVIELRMNHCINVYANGPVPLCSVLIYNPFRRYEAWRLITYMLVHSGYVHIICNILVQIVLGIPLEIYHGPLRISAVYLAGVLTGSLASSVTDPQSFLAGASAGSYALLLAHIPTLILNWKSMTSFVEWLVSLIVPTIALVDFGVTIYNRYTAGDGNENIGYAAHLGGAAAGLLIGMNVLRNLEHEKWEGTLRLICWIIWVVGVITVILINSFGANVIFPESDFTDIKECKYYADETCQLQETTF